MSEGRTPQWVSDALNWPTPDQCRAMSPAEAEALIAENVDLAIHAQLLVDFHTARVTRFTDIARRLSAVHPKAADRVAARNGRTPAPKAN